MITVEPLRQVKSKKEKRGASPELVAAARATIQRLVNDTTSLKKPIIDVLTIDRGPRQSIYVLATLIEPIKHQQQSPPISFSHLTASRLVPGKQLNVAASNSIELELKVGQGVHLVRLSQVLIHLPRELVDPMERGLDHFKDELILTHASPYFAELLSNARSGSIDSHRTAICRYLTHFAKRMGPRGAAVFNHAQWMMTTWPAGIAEGRAAGHLARLIIGSFMMRTRFETKPAGALAKRSLEVDVFPARSEGPASRKTGIGICTLLTFRKESEVFGSEQVFGAIEALYPNTRPILGAEFADNLPSSSERIVYIEIEKRNGGPFTRSEIIELRARLPNELKGRIEKLIHPVFIPRSDEELLHHIAWLSRELREITDLPQVMISFDKQIADDLRFSALIVRVRRPGDSEVTALVSRAKIDVRMRLVKIIGHLRDIYPQEAIVLDITLPKRGFLRKDGSIDLLSARAEIAKELSEMLGELRDVNGGMIIKQNEAFTRLKKAIGPIAADREFLLENFFYSITPTPMQGVLAADPLVALFYLVEECIAKGKESMHRFAGIHCLFVVTTTHKGLKEHLDTTLEQLGLSDLDAASVELTIDSRLVIAYLYANHNASRLRFFLRTLNTALEQFKSRRASQQVVRLNIPRGILSFDPRIGGDQQSGIVKRMLYDGLMRLDKTGVPTLALASGFEISPDRLTYTFTLKKGVQWSTGDPIIAYDFEYAWKKVLDPGFQTPFVTIFYIIENAAAASEGRCPLDSVGIRALDERRLEVRLEKPAPYFLELAAHWAFSPVSSKSDRIHPGWAQTGAETYAASGPFKLSLFDYGKRIELVKNPKYWDTQNVRLEKIEIFMVHDPYAELQMYENDEIDWVGKPFSIIPFDASHEMKRRGKLLTSPVAATTWLEFNVESFPFNNTKMRRAFSIGFDRTRLTREVMPGRNAPATGVVPRALSTRETPYFEDGNKELAKQLFEEALKEMGCTREGIPEISILCPATELWQAITREITQQLRALFDINFCIRVYEWEEFFTHRSNNFFQIAGISWYCWHSDPTYVLDLFKERSNSLNSTQWESRKYAAYLDEASSERNEKKRLEILNRAEELLIEEMPVMPLVYDGDCYMRKDYLQGLTISKTGDIDFKEAYIKHE